MDSQILKSIVRSYIGDDSNSKPLLIDFLESTTNQLYFLLRADCRYDTMATLEEHVNDMPSNEARAT